ncbi:MAG: FkbM family methyltransferase [Bacteroidales bacterium]|nr:FkbM family methyltransferase [Bacteroidales bacterium]
MELLKAPKFSDKSRLEPYGYKVYSQNDEDGIINEIFNRVGTTNKTFVEFGAYDGLENNTTYLLMQGWRGLWIDGDKNKMKRMLKTYDRAIQHKQLMAECAFITKDNIDNLIGKHINGEIDMLSIDIDGNDYWVWQNIKSIQPRVVVVEYNAKFPPPYHWKMEYDEHYWWDGTDKMGMSLQAATDLGEELGYQLVGTNICGVNAFFVRKDVVNKQLVASFPLPATAEHLFNPARYFLNINRGHSAKHFLG